MVQKSKATKEEIFVTSAPLSPADERLGKLFDELEQGSLNTLEEAARQIITLSTTLLAAFFGVLAFKDAPAYLKAAEMKIIAALALISFFGALFFALKAVLPAKYSFPQASLTAKRGTLNEMLEHKRAALNWASWTFGFGALMVLCAVLDILIFRL